MRNSLIVTLTKIMTLIMTANDSDSVPTRDSESARDSDSEHDSDRVGRARA